MKNKITIELTIKEADILTEFLSDAAYLTLCSNTEPTINDFIDFITKYQYDSNEGRVIDKVWSRVAFKIGKTDSSQ